jgi:uncharacterized protein
MDVNPAVLAWFAFLHGSVAAEFAIRLRYENVITELAPTEFEHLCEAIRLHSDGHTEGEPALRACWDADRLDLGHVGITPNPRYLCTPHSNRALHIHAAVRMSDGSARRLA